MVATAVAVRGGFDPPMSYGPAPSSLCGELLFQTRWKGPLQLDFATRRSIAIAVIPRFPACLRREGGYGNTSPCGCLTGNWLQNLGRFWIFSTKPSLLDTTIRIQPRFPIFFFKNLVGLNRACETPGATRADSALLRLRFTAVVRGLGPPDPRRK